MKSIAKRLVVNVLAWQIRRLRRKNKIIIIGVAGSTGKTSTKFAVASVLEQKYRVNFQEGNYNDVVSVPLVFFNRSMPSLFNPLAWAWVFASNELKIRKPYPFDIVITELGTDGPGQITEFNKYLELDIGVLTAISPEHLEFFGDIEAVAKEELNIAGLSRTLLINTDFCDKKFLKVLDQNYISYGTTADARYRLSDIKYDQGYRFKITKDSKTIADSKADTVSKVQLFSVCAAVSVANELGLSKKQVNIGISSIVPVYGRMNKLKGINGSTIIDDTYNSSPLALKQAINSLYELKAPNKIVILGSMNELGKFSAEEHMSAGEYCDPSQISLLVTVGADANKYLASTAKNQGCVVKSFDNSYEAGDYLKDKIKPGTLLLAKGSQSGLFIEEALKPLLADPNDTKKLVRQSDDWIKVKKSQLKGGTIS